MAPQIVFDMFWRSLPKHEVGLEEFEFLKILICVCVITAVDTLCGVAAPEV